MSVKAPKGPRNTIVVSVHIPADLIEFIDECVRQGFYINRSDFIRNAIRFWIQEEARRLAPFLKLREVP